MWGRGVLQVILSPLGSGSTRQHDRQVRVSTHGFSLPPSTIMLANPHCRTTGFCYFVNLSHRISANWRRFLLHILRTLPPFCWRRYGCGPITIGGKGSSRTAAGSGGSNWRRNRQAGCFGMLAAFTPLPFMVTTHPLNLSTSLVYAGTTVGQ